VKRFEEFPKNFRVKNSGIVQGFADHGEAKNLK
jgi:hypothetical protein